MDNDGILDLGSVTILVVGRMGWEKLAAAQHGVISRAQFRAHGWPNRQISKLVTTRQFETTLEGVYLVPGAPRTYIGQLWAAVLHTRGIIGFDTAGYVWKQLPSEPDRVHICVEHPLRSRIAPWIKLHRVPVLPWGRTIREELPITTPAWTLLDLVGNAGRASDASTLLDRGLQRQ